MDFEFYWDEEHPQYHDIEHLLETDAHARRLYDWGFIEENVDTTFRRYSREAFFDYLWELGYDEDGFDWRQWRLDYLETLAS